MMGRRQKLPVRTEIDHRALMSVLMVIAWLAWEMMR